MYSVVLMAALSAGGTAPDCHGHCHSSCGGCYGGCYGCYGGGCYGGCSGCSGCYGGYGGCYGGYGYGYGCYGTYSCHGCYGCYGCYGCSGYNPVMYGTPVMTTPATPTPPPDMPPVDKGKMDKTGDMKDKETTAATKAKIVVELPADAKLFIDDQPMKTPSATRVFSTPTLQKGQAYYYEMRAEMVREGKTITESKRVVVSAGAEIPVTFAELLAAAGNPKANVADAR